MCLIFFFFFPLNLTCFLYYDVDNAYDFCSQSRQRVKKRHKLTKAPRQKKKETKTKLLFSLSLSLSLSPRLSYDNGDEEYAFLRRDVV